MPRGRHSVSAGMYQPNKRTQALHAFSAALREEGAALCEELAHELKLARGELEREQLAEAQSLLAGWLRPGALDASVVSGERRPAGAVAIQLPVEAPLSALARTLPAAFLTGNHQVLVNLPVGADASARRVARLVEAHLPAVVVSALAPDLFLFRSLTDPYTRSVWASGDASLAQPYEALVREVGTRLVFESPGNDPVVVGRHADLAAAAVAAAEGFRMGGLHPAATGRVYVHRSVHEELVGLLCDIARERVVAPLGDPHAMVSALRSETHRTHLLRVLDQAEDSGAGLDVGLDFRNFPGEEGLILYPTVVSGCDPDLDIVRTVKRGPVVPVVPFDSEGELSKMLDEGGCALRAFGLDPATVKGLAPRFGGVLVDQGVFSPGGLGLLRRWGGGPSVWAWEGRQTRFGPADLQQGFTVGRSLPGGRLCP